MKKLFAILLALAMVVCLAACGESDSSSTTSSTDQDEYGNFVSVYGSRRTVSIDEFPYTINYNGLPVILTDVSFYESKSETYHDYTLYVLVTLDLSELDDDQQYWLRSEDLDAYCYITSEENDYDNERTTKLGSVYLDTGELLIGFMSSPYIDKARYSFAGSAFTAAIDITQEEADEDGIDEETTYYRVTLPDELPDPDEEMDETSHYYVTKWMNDMLNRMSS